MRVRILGSTASSLAVRGGDGPWFLVSLGDERVRRTTLEPGLPTALEGSSLTVEVFPVGGEASGLVFRDRATGGVMTYAPALGRLDDGLLCRFEASDVVLVDGDVRPGDEPAWLAALARLERPRKALVHVKDAPEREALIRADVRVAQDGFELEL